MAQMWFIDRAIATVLPAVPRPVVRHFADRYMAGETLADAVATVRALNGQGAMATIDVLGEFVNTAEEAEQTVAEYEQVLAAIESERLDANISVKLSALGLEIDRGLASANAARLVSEAGRRGIFVRVDMEHSGLTDATLEIYRELRGAGHDLVGIVIQAYMRRSLADVRALVPLNPNVRLVKGIYIEPRGIAYRDPGVVNRNYVELMEELIGAGAYVAAATHDRVLVDEVLRLADRHRLDPDRYEFQMLLGVADDLRGQLIAHGRRVRVYVPYGGAWYGYSVRRLKENPKVAGYVAGDLLRRLRPR
jgi:proline dehydrogenase